MAFVETRFIGNLQAENKVNLKEYYQTSEAVNFSIITDYPEERGGDEEFPTPFSTFLAAFNSCQASYLRHYCTREGLDFKDITINLDIDHVETELVTDDNGNEFIKRGEEVDTFKTHVVFPDSFPKEHIEPALEFMANCKVARNVRDFNPKTEHTHEIN